jgi:hypothetical protein
MFEKRRKGRELAKITSYAYVIMGILLIGVTIALNSDTGTLALAQKGVTILELGLGSILYFIFGAVIYFLSTRYKNDEVLWKAYIAIAILNLIVIGFSIILLVFSLLLVISGNDIRKELI